MMKLFRSLALLAAACGLSFAQTNSLTLTTLSAALTNSSLQNQVTVGTAPTLTLPFEIYVDREAMLVKSQSTTVLTVVRGYNGTSVGAHAANQVVFEGMFSQFYQGDAAGNCTAANMWSSPILNVYTGRLFTCNSAKQFAQADLSYPLAPMFNRTATAVSYTAVITDNVVGVTSTASARTITLFSATGLAGKVLIVKDESGAANTNNITITPAAGNIDGAGTKVISTAYGVVRLYTDGTNWFTF